MPRAIGPDKQLVKDQLQGLQALIKAWGYKFFIAQMIWILTKLPKEFPDQQDELRPTKLVPFVYNKVQDHLEINLGRNNRLLKARQQGGTTYFTIRRLVIPVMTNEGTNGLLVSQNSKYVTEHFAMVQRAFRYFGVLDPKGTDEDNFFAKQLKDNLLHTAYSNRKELVFDMLDSKIMVESAEVPEGGQGITVSAIVKSEVARWPGQPRDTVSNLRGSLIPGGTDDEESTANGMGGYFCEAFMESWNNPTRADAKAHFYEWWWSDEYRDELTPNQLTELQNDLQSDEKKLQEKFQLDINQIAWRRRTIIEQKANFEEKYPEDPITAFLVAGNMYFDKQILIAKKRDLTGVTPWQVTKSGECYMFKPRVPGRRYVIGADPATGRMVTSENLDFAAMVIIDLETGEEMASYKAKVTPQQLAFDAAELGEYYNNAVIAVERTGDGGTTILTLQGDCRYGAIYKHKEWWKRERKIVEIEGFPTTPKTRPIALNMLNGHLMEHPEHFHDPRFIDEALTFVRDEKGKPEAAVGCHDDTVSCRWIAYAVRKALLGYYDPVTQKSEGYISADRMVIAA